MSPISNGNLIYRDVTTLAYRTFSEVATFPMTPNRYSEMSLTIAEKLRKLRLHQPFEPSQEKFAQTLGISRAALSKYENGSPVPEHILQSIAVKVGVPLAWFVDGRDSPIPDAKMPGRQPKEPDLSSPAILKPRPTLKLKYAGTVPAGEWGDPLAGDEEIDIDVKLFDERRYVTTVTGSSCYPALLQGDIAIWQQDFNPSPGLIILAQRKGDHSCTVKQLILDREGNFKLRPLNPDFAFDLEGFEGWGAIARLVAVIRHFDGVEITWHLPAGLRPRNLLGHIPKEEDLDVA